jgi:hypothetical protein
MAASTFRDAIDFLVDLGVYDIVLPFLLVFTIFFAILEKTKILGIEKIENQTYTKKNLNAMVSFVVAFLVIASTQLVAIINEVMANIVLLLLLAVSFLLLVGVFFTDKEFSLENSPPWVRFFMIVMFIGIVVIFLNALGWLQAIFRVFKNFEAAWAANLIFLAIIVVFMWFITYDKKPMHKKSEKNDKH